MPVLSELRRRGLSGPLMSTQPPMTLPAWSTMLTGCNPGKHGIFDFTRLRPGSWDPEYTNATHRRVPTLHRILSERGGRVVSLAVPGTWPPEPLSGVVVSGFDSPVSTEIDGSFCHPPGLHAELLRRFGGLRFADFQESFIGPDWHIHARSSMLREIERKEDVGRWLLQKERWDCFMLLFGESDTASHHFWMHHDPRSPRHPRGGAPALLRDTLGEIYARLDQALGRLLDVAGAQVVCVCSDHGFGGAGDRVLYLNRLLEQHGWLRYRRPVQVQGLRSGTALVDRARSLALRTLPARAQGKLFRSMPSAFLGWMEGRSRYGDLDLPRCCALSDELSYAATLRMNMPESERPAATRELTQLLLEWEVDGHQPVARVWSREELYEGPHVGLAPDLLLELALRDGYSYTLLPSVRVPSGTTWRRLLPAEHAGGKGLGMNGSHRPEGLLVMAGEGIRAGVVVEAGLADLAPTMLHLLGEAVPAHMDGRVLSEALVGEPPMVETAPSAVPLLPERLTSRAEAALIHARLTALGYL